MASNTTFKPAKVSDFEASKLNFNGQGLIGTAIAGQSTPLDFQITDDCLLTGAILLSKNSVFGDHINLQIVDVDGLLAPAGTVLNQFVTSWYLADDIQKQLDMQVAYPAKIYAGLYIRVVYISTGNNDVDLAINYTLHKVLI